MKNWNFQSLYRQLVDENQRDTALFNIKEQSPESLILFKKYLDNENDKALKSILVGHYNEIINHQYPFIIQQFNHQDYITLEELFIHYSNYLFELSGYENIQKFELFISKLIKKIDLSLIQNGSPKEIIQELNYKITQGFNIENEFIGNYNLDSIIQHKSISQFTLSILLIIIGERLGLPIFGIPFQDKLVLCYAERYCGHSETVFEDDILFYIVVGEKDLIYTPHDLELYAAITEVDLTIEAKMPQSSQHIIQNWLHHMLENKFDFKSNENLSIKYQQIFSQATDYRNF